MGNLISKEEYDEFMKFEGELRGVALKTESEFVLRQEGKEGFEKLAKAVAEYGLDLKNIKTMGFYPLGIEAILLVLIQRLFNYDEKKFEEMGGKEAKFSFVIRLYIKNFYSMEKMVKEAPLIWRKFYSTGNLKVSEYKEKERCGAIRIENFKVHPLQCWNIRGFFASVLQMVVGSRVLCDETRCIFKGDKFHEFSVKW